MATPKPRQAAVRSFNLSRWFAIVGLISIATISAIAGWALSRFVSYEMLQQEGELTQQFVQTLVSTERSLQSYFSRGEAEDSLELELALSHISRMQDMLRANVYNLDRRVIWSSDRQLEGQTFGPNEELEHALAGRLVVHPETHHEHGGKEEHRNLQKRADLFVEIYVPVRDAAGREVLGAIEFYKHPRGLTLLLADLRRWITFGALAFGALLFLALFGLVRRADRIMQSQERRLLDNEALAVVGEMASVVAHGIRNPLATIRSSAELVQELAPAARTEAADIVAQCDRLGAWLREWLGYSADTPLRPTALALAPLVHSACDEVATTAQRRRVQLQADLPEGLPPVLADPLLVGQVLRSVLANALEALPRGGRVCFDARADATTLTLGVQDDGPGLSKEARQRAGQPLFTTKPQGLGVGLALARRVLRRHGGQLRIDDAAGGGTRVEITLRRAAA